MVTARCSLNCLDIVDDDCVKSNWNMYKFRKRLFVEFSHDVITAFTYVYNLLLLVTYSFDCSSQKYSTNYFYKSLYSQNNKFYFYQQLVLSIVLVLVGIPYWNILSYYISSTLQMAVIHYFNEVNCIWDYTFF